MAEATVLMLIPGITGNSTFVGFDPEPGEEGDHTGWIPVDGCTFKFARKDTVSDAKKDEPNDAAKPATTVDPFTITRTSDYTSAEILMWLARAGSKDAKLDEPVLIDFCHPSGRYFLRYELSGVELVAGSLSYSHPDEAKETLTFTYDEVTVYQRPVDEKGMVDLEAEHRTHYVVELPEGFA